MAVSDADIEAACEVFAPLGAIRARRMFGGAGVYCDDLMFAVLDDGRVFLKADGESRGLFEAAGLAPFSYETKSGAVGVLSYFEAPAAIFDDAGALELWAGRALDAARRGAARKAAPRKRKPARRPGPKPARP